LTRHAPASAPHPDNHDDLDVFLAEELEEPTFRAAYEDAGYRENLVRDLVCRRQALGLNQSVLAARMATTQSAVSDFEGCVGDARISTFQRYARAVECRLQLAVCDAKPHHDLIYSLPQRPSAPVAAWAAASRYTVDQVAISALPSKVDLDDLLWRDGHVILFTPDAEAERAW
jgi:hypothetical protein